MLSLFLSYIIYLLFFFFLYRLFFFFSAREYLCALLLCSCDRSCLPRFSFFFFFYLFFCSYGS